nr:zinc ABC transporter substrate-binding protein [Alteribacillus iranensis]
MSACNEEKSAVSQEDEDDPIQIVTTIAQIGEPLQVIGGDRVEVESLMGPSVDPHLYQATQSDISTFENADIIFYNGLGLEANMVDIFEEIGKSRPVLAIGETIEEENLLEDEEGNVDPHIWFDLDLWMNALDAAVASLSEYAPEHADYFQENKAAYFAKLEEVKQDSTKLAALPKNKRILVTAHDAFGYFGNMHDIQVIGLQGLSTDSEIGVSDINDTIAVIEKHKVPAIFIESSINDSSIQAVIEGAASKGLDVELGGELYSDAMGEEGTEEGTYIGMYRHNVNTIYEALSGGEN